MNRHTLDHKDEDGFSQSPRKKFGGPKISSMIFFLLGNQGTGEPGF